MMKVISAHAMAELEKKAYQAGYTDYDFMEQAGLGVADAIQDFIQMHQLAPHILLLCGKGNNAGDTFLAGYHLLNRGYTVTAIHLETLNQCSPLCQLQARRFINKGGALLQQTAIDWQAYSLVVDGIFGTGFHGQVQEPYASLIESANNSHLPIISVDIPSGLNGSTGEASMQTIRATETLFLGLPKTGFFLLKGWEMVGHLRGVNFGLPSSYIEEVTADLLLMTPQRAKDLLPPIKRNRHKYQVGHAVGLSGSPTMPGAALLASLAALRGGSGIVHLLHPEGMQMELSSSPYELIKVPYQYADSQTVLSLMHKGDATFVGPGLGLTNEVRSLIKEVVPFLEKPCVIDADALTIFSEENFKFPLHTILTPHTGEMQKLLHRKEPLIIDQSVMQICQAYAEEKQVTLILKGAPSFIFHPRTPISVNPTGDPGMATAGSGDALTGLLAALLSQKLSCHQAALLGVYLHGIAGELAAHAHTSYSMIATDIISHFSSAYKSIQEETKVARDLDWV